VEFFLLLSLAAWVAEEKGGWGSTLLRQDLEATFDMGSPRQCP
jgi:hypothetical protein